MDNKNCYKYSSYLLINKFFEKICDEKIENLFEGVEI